MAAVMSGRPASCAVLCEIIPGGVPAGITATRAAAILSTRAPAGPAGPVAGAWHDLATLLLTR